MTDTTAGEGVSYVDGRLDMTHAPSLGRYIAKSLASEVSGNRQPCMSGDNRDRLHAHVRHRFDRTCETVAAEILEALAAQPDTGDVAALLEALEPFAEMADKFAGSMVEVCHPHPDNPSPTIQPLPVAYLERAKQALAALSKPNAPGRERGGRAVGLLSEMSSMAETTTMELMHAHHHGPGWYTKGSAGMWSQILMWEKKCADKVAEARDFLATQKAEGA